MALAALLNCVTACPTEEPIQYWKTSSIEPVQDFPDIVSDPWKWIIRSHAFVKERDGGNFVRKTVEWIAWYHSVNQRGVATREDSKRVYKVHVSQD